MPELPEVETTKNAISKVIIDQKVEEIIISRKDLRWQMPNQLPKQLLNAILLKPYRLGKYILIPTNKKNTLLLHLGMSGKIKLEDYLSNLEKHDHFRIIVSGKNKKYFLTYNDPRRFGFIDLVKNSYINQHFLLSKLGLDPFEKKFNKEYLLRKFASRNVSIKNALMDQTIIAGIGNIYASEILFHSKIHPLYITKFLSEKKISTLIKSTKFILNNAIRAGGTSLKNFKDPNGKLGYFKQNLKVYGKKGKKCVDCSKQINIIIVNNRSTFYCKKCQKSDIERFNKN